MRNEDVIKEVDKRFEDYKIFIAQQFENNKEFTNLRITSLSGVMRDKFDQAYSQREEIIAHQEVTNSRVTILEKETRLLRWIARNPVIAAILTILLITGLVVAVHKLGIETLLKML